MRLLALVCFVVVLVLSPVMAQEVSDEDLARFIRLGIDDKHDDIQAGCMARASGWDGFLQAAATENVETYSVGVSTWLFRVAMEAHVTSQRLLPAPTVDEMRALEQDLVVVSVSPLALTMTGARLLNHIDHVVLRARGDKSNRTVVQPLEVATQDTHTYENLFGASVEASGVLATFEAAPVLEIARLRDVEVLIMTTGGQRKCHVDDKKVRRQFNIW